MLVGSSILSLYWFRVCGAAIHLASHLPHNGPPFVGFFRFPPQSSTTSAGEFRPQSAPPAAIARQSRPEASRGLWRPFRLAGGSRAARRKPRRQAAGVAVEPPIAVVVAAFKSFRRNTLRQNATQKTAVRQGVHHERESFSKVFLNAFPLGSCVSFCGRSARPPLDFFGRPADSAGGEFSVRGAPRRPPTVQR